MKQPTSQIFFTIFLAAIFVLPTGCTISAIGKERIARRENNLAKVAAAWRRSESHRPGILDRVFGKIRDSIRRDRQRAAEIPDNFRDWYRRDAVDFRNKQPQIRRKFNDIMAGQPEDIQPTAEKMIF